MTTETTTTETTTTEAPARVATRHVVALSYDECRSLRKTVSTEESRPILNNVHVTRDHVETTNGHVLLRTPARYFAEFDDSDTLEAIPTDDRPQFAPYMFPREVLANVKTRQVLTLDVATGALAIHADPDRAGAPGPVLLELAEPATSTTAEASKTFPNTDQVWPGYRSGRSSAPREELHRVAFSGKYLKAFGEVAMMLGGEAARCEVWLRIGEEGAARAAELYIGGPDAGVSGLLMPLRLVDK